MDAAAVTGEAAAVSAAAREAVAVSAALEEGTLAAAEQAATGDKSR